MAVYIRARTMLIVPENENIMPYSAVLFSGPNTFFRTFGTKVKWPPSQSKSKEIHRA